MTSFFDWLILIANILAAVCQFGNKTESNIRAIGYDLSAPDRVYVLPPALHEISGITEVDETSIACVQDENGIIFIYDINKNKIIRQFIFGAEGDYEAIARVNETLYVLRSDEVLNEIINFRSDEFERKAYLAKIPGKDTEGLCYDRKNNRLLLMPKTVSDDKPDKKDKRFIYAFDLVKKEIVSGPVISFDTDAIGKFAIDNNIKVPMKGKKGKKKKPDIRMIISDMCINPITNKLFALSGIEQILFVFDMNGNIEYIERLDQDLFTQPEGITFMGNGDMFISNEGRNDSPKMVRFKYRPGTSSKPTVPVMLRENRVNQYLQILGIL